MFCFDTFLVAFQPHGHNTIYTLRFWIYKSDGLHQSHGFQECIVNLTEVGIEIQHDDQQQWFIPWEAMPEIYDGSTSRYLLPDSHPHVKHLCARFSFGFSSCTGCQFHLASSSLDQLDAISQNCTAPEFAVCGDGRFTWFRGSF